MDIRDKRMLSNLAYFTLLIISLGLSVLFCVALATFAVPVWAMIIYYVWTAIAIGVLLYDAYCMFIKGSKYLSGLVLYFLAISAVIMSIVLYFCFGRRICCNTGRRFNYVSNCNGSVW